MLTLILLGIFFIVPLVIFIVQYVKENDYTAPVIIWLATEFLLNLCTYASLININKSFEYTVERYENLKKTVDECYSDTYIDLYLRDEVISMNNEISKHKVMHNSIWKGPWYSKEVGELPKISLDRKTNKE